MIAKADSERRFAILAALLLPYLMLLVVDWTVTPVGLIDAWIYRALGRDLVHANASMGEYYYAARAFVLVPQYLLTRLFREGPAHVLYGLACAHVLLFSVLDFLTSVARPRTRLPGVLLFGACLYLLRSLGWGYIDGSLLTWFMVGLAGMARWFRPGTSAFNRRLSALLAGACFIAMLLTHPMTLPMLVTPLGLAVWLQQRAGTHANRPRWWVLWLELAAGGLGAVLVMGIVCQWLYGRFLFFMPIVNAALRISSADWKRPVQAWLITSNWLLPFVFAVLAGAGVWVMARVRRLHLTGFERFAYVNVASLFTLLVFIELFTHGYWLEYSWFVSYFLPATLLALTAMVGERIRVSSPRVMMGMFAVVVGASSLAYLLELPYVLPQYLTSYFPYRAPPPDGIASLESIQFVVAAAALLGLLVLRSRSRRPTAGATLFAGAVTALVLGGPVNYMGRGDEAESQFSASIAEAIVTIQDELKDRRPAYWYDDRSPLSRVFVSISSGHLASYSLLGGAYPEGARVFRTIAPGRNRFFATGDPVVIFDETMERFPRAQRAFAELGIALTETRRVRMDLGERSFWIVFASLNPARQVMRALDLQTNLKAATSSHSERVSEREKGFLSYGPYVPFAPGTHHVTFHLRVLDTPSGEDLGLVEVGQFAGTDPITFQRAKLLASEAGPNGELDIPFEFTSKEAVLAVEFRTFTEGNSRLELRSIDVETPGPPLDVPRLPLAAASATLGGRAAETVKSADIKTSGLAAHLEAEALGTGHVTVRAALLLGADSQAWVELSPADALAATVGTTTLPLKPHASLGATWYETEFDGDAAGTPVTVSLTRQFGVSATQSAVALPAPIVFLAPPPGVEVSRTQGLSLAWRNADRGTLHLTAMGPCIQRVEVDLEGDAGLSTLPAFIASPGNETTRCNVVVSLARSTRGTVDAAWGKGGEFEAVASSTLTVNSGP